MNPLRDTYKDRAYYDKEIESRLERAKEAPERDIAIAKKTGDAWRRGSILKSSGFWPLHMVLRFRYCRGDDLAELQYFYPSVIEILEAADQASLEGGQVACKTINIRGDRWIILPLVAFGLGLKVEPNLLQRLAARVAPGDVLLDLVLKHFQPDRVVGKKLHEAKLYRGLLDVLKAPTEHQARLLLKYLNSWEKKLRLRD